VQALEGGDSVNLSSLLNKLALLHEKLGRLGDAEAIYMDALRTIVDDCALPRCIFVTFEQESRSCSSATTRWMSQGC
jgi:hypothetical protein